MHDILPTMLSHCHSFLRYRFPICGRKTFLFQCLPYFKFIQEDLCYLKSMLCLTHGTIYMAMFQVWCHNFLHRPMLHLHPFANMITIESSANKSFSWVTYNMYKLRFTVMYVYFTTGYTLPQT